MREDYQEPILILSDEIERLSESVVSLLRERSHSMPEDLRSGISHFESGNYGAVVKGLTCSDDDPLLLTAAHLLRGLASLHTTKLEDALSEEGALEAMNPAAAGAFKNCYRIPASIRQLIAKDLPLSPIPVRAPDEEYVWRHSAALVLTARTLTMSGDPSSAVSCADEVIRLINPEVSSDRLRSVLARAHYSRGFALSSQRDYPGASRALANAIELDPVNPSYYNEMGFISNHLGHYDRALEMYQRAKTLDETDDKHEAAVALRGMSFAFIEKSDFVQAEQVLRESLALEPGNETAVNEIAHIYDLLDERDILDGIHPGGGTYSVECAVCRGRFQPPASVLQFLKRAVASGEQGSIDLPGEVFGVPLGIECPFCHHSIRLSRSTPLTAGSAVIETIAGTFGRGQGWPELGLASTPHPAANPERAARMNVEYITSLSAWQALPWWKRVTTRKPQRPTGI